MTDMEFLQMLSGIDEDLVTKADRPVPFRQKRGFKIMLVAAVLAFALLITPVAGAFALAVGYIATRDHVGGGSEPQDPTQGDAQQDFTPGGLVGELLGGIDWGALKDTVGADGNVNWKDFFAVLQGKDDEKAESGTDVAYALEMLDDGTWKLKKYTGFSNKYILSIPEELNGAKITVIGEGALAYNEDANHVTIPDSVRVIESGAFTGCPDLVSVEMSDSVQEIGAGAFENCTSLLEINLSDNLQTLGENAFTNCKSLQSLSLPEGLTEIGRDAFAGTAITNITIPSTVTTMGDMLFSGCENLETVIFAGDAPEILYFESATGLAPNTAYNIYHPLGANGFTEPEWQGHPCQALLYEAEDFILEKLPDYPGYQSTLPYYSWSVLATEQTQGKGRPLEVINNYPSFQYYQSEYSFLPDDTAYDVNYFKTNALIIAQVKVSPKEELVRLSGIVLRQDGAATEVYPIFTFNSQPERDESYTYTYVLIEVPKNDWKNLTVGAYAESHIYSHNVYPDGIARSHHYYGFLDRHASYPSDKETDTACG